MEKAIEIFLLISLIGILYYSIWVIILIKSSLHNAKDIKNDVDILDYKLYILMPMLNEANVVKQTLSNFIYQTKNLSQVKLGVIDDGSTDGTAKKIKEFIYENNCETQIKLIQRILPNAQTGKGDALNYGLNVLRKEFNTDLHHIIIGVLDADAIMYENDLRKVLVTFKKVNDLSLLQTKVRIYNIQNWLERMQDVEFTTINDWIQRERNKLNNAAASGNGQFIRLSSIKNNLKPWGNALLEDFEFSTKFLLKGKKTFYAENIIVYQEAVDKYNLFIRQRTRWVQGGLDCTQKYLKKVFKSKALKFGAKFEMVFFMLLPFITVIVGTSNVVSLIYALFNITKYWKLIIFLIIINVLLDIYMGVKYCGSLKNLKIKTIFRCGGMVLYNIILFPAILIAFYKKIRKKSKWDKTAHGIE